MLYLALAQMTERLKKASETTVLDEVGISMKPRTEGSSSSTQSHLTMVVGEQCTKEDLKIYTLLHVLLSFIRLSTRKSL